MELPEEVRLQTGPYGGVLRTDTKRRTKKSPGTEAGADLSRSCYEQ